VRGRETFDATYAAFKQLLIGSWHRDVQLAQQAAE
jgi:chromosome partitioning protein